MKTYESIYVRDHRTLVQIYNKKSFKQRIIVFLHGTPLDAAILENFAIALTKQDDSCVILYDFRGHGSASSAPSGRTLEEFVSDLIVILKSLKLTSESITLGGWSFGGMVAQAFAQSYAVNHLWLVATIGKAATLPVPDQVLQSAINATQETTYPRIPESIINRNLRRWFWQEKDWQDDHPVVLQAATAMRITNAEQYLHAIKIINSADLTTQWRPQCLPQSVKLIAFKDDPVASCERMETTILNPLKSAGHSACSYQIFDGLHGQLVLTPELIACHILNLSM